MLKGLTDNQCKTLSRILDTLNKVCTCNNLNIYFYWSYGPTNNTGDKWNILISTALRGVSHFKFGDSTSICGDVCYVCSILEVITNKLMRAGKYTPISCSQEAGYINTKELTSILKR